MILRRLLLSRPADWIAAAGLWVRRKQLAYLWPEAFNDAVAKYERSKAK